MARRAPPIDIAVLGCGHAARAHARVLRRTGSPPRLHFASRDSSRAARFARDCGGVGSFGSYEDAMHDPEISTVLVTTPPDLHLELTLTAVAAGKQVIVEKPAFFEPEDFRSVRLAAREAGVRVYVAENYFYKPLRRRLATLLEQGAVGDPLLLDIHAVKRQAVDGWRADPASAGGGGFFEGGIHWINLMSNLGMEVRRIRGHRAVPTSSGDPHAATGTQRSEESIVVVAEFENGAVGTLHFSWEVPSPLRGVRLSRLHGRGGSIWFESNGIFLVARGARSGFWIPGLRDLGGFHAMWTDFLEALRTGREPAMTFDLAERDVRFVRDVYRSLGD